jgi:hypothetical protein
MLRTKLDVSECRRRLEERAVNWSKPPWRRPRFAWGFHRPVAGWISADGFSLARGRRGLTVEANGKFVGDHLGTRIAVKIGVPTWGAVLPLALVGLWATFIAILIHPLFALMPLVWPLGVAFAISNARAPAEGRFLLGFLEEVLEAEEEWS